MYQESTIRELQKKIERLEMPQVPLLKRDLSLLEVTTLQIGTQTDLFTSFEEDIRDSLRSNGSSRIDLNESIWNLKERINELERKNSDLAYHLN